MNEIADLLKNIGPGVMSHTAYDTAWIARLGEIDTQLSNQALDWITENQLPDGSWGAREVFYYHDRVICTLAVMIALTHRERHYSDKIQVEKGLLALERITLGATEGQASEPNGATVGFEMIVPTLVREAEKLGIIKQKGDQILGRLKNFRDAKMAKLAGLKINRHITPAFSSEMAGTDHIELLDAVNLQERNGSVGNSPAATAYFATFVSPGDRKAISYLKSIISPNGGASFTAPFDIFERSWVLWNLALIGPLDDEIRALCAPHLAHIADNWDKINGVSFSETYSPKDGDDTGLAFNVLSQFGITMDVQTVLSYEEEEYFRCYPLETNTSISVNINILGALKQAGFEGHHPSVKKILAYLRHNQTQRTFWKDKWHTSPFYTTARAVIAGHSYDFDMCKRAVDWILESQKPDGSWGYNPNVSTAEETAYCIQALMVWVKFCGTIEKERIQRAADWLESNSNGPYQPLWIGKVLYSPEHVVKSAILSAMEMTRQ